MYKNLYIKKAGQSKPCNDSIEGDGRRLAKSIDVPLCISSPPIQK